jgi:purine-binding chemotaxis protein CheW
MNGIVKAGQHRMPEVQDTISLCSMIAGDCLFGIDTRMIKEVLGKRVLRRVPHAPSYIAGIVSYRGDVLTAVSLRALLGLAPIAGESTTMVLHDKESGDSFGFMVDSVAGVVVVERKTHTHNPSTLDERSALLYDGAFRREDDLIVQLTPQKLRPRRLGEIALFRNELALFPYLPIKDQREGVV